MNGINELEYNATEARQPEILKQLELLAIAIGEIESSLDDISRKVSPVMRPSLPNDDKVANMEQTQTDIGTSIANMRGELVRITAQANDVRDRIEL